jgi:hypothetical protein
MSLPQLPSEGLPRTGKRLLGQWDFRLQLENFVGVTHLTHVVLTDRRLVVLYLLSREQSQNSTGSGLPGFWGSRLAPKVPRKFRGEMEKWHVVLNVTLAEIPEPTIGIGRAAPGSSLPSNRALLLGEKHFWLGEDPSSGTMLSELHKQWAASQQLPRLIR